MIKNILVIVLISSIFIGCLDSNDKPKKSPVDSKSQKTQSKNPPTSVEDEKSVDPENIEKHRSDVVKTSNPNISLLINRITHLSEGQSALDELTDKISTAIQSIESKGGQFHGFANYAHLKGSNRLYTWDYKLKNMLHIAVYSPKLGHSRTDFYGIINDAGKFYIVLPVNAKMDKVLSHILRAFIFIKKLPHYARHPDMGDGEGEKKYKFQAYDLIQFDDFVNKVTQIEYHIEFLLGFRHYYAPSYPFSLITLGISQSANRQDCVHCFRFPVFGILSTVDHDFMNFVSRGFIKYKSKHVPGRAYDMPMSCRTSVPVIPVHGSIYSTECAKLVKDRNFLDQVELRESVLSKYLSKGLLPREHFFRVNDVLSVYELEKPSYFYRSVKSEIFPGEIEFIFEHHLYNSEYIENCLVSSEILLSNFKSQGYEVFRKYLKYPIEKLFVVNGLRLPLDKQSTYKISCNFSGEIDLKRMERSLTGLFVIKSKQYDNISYYNHYSMSASDFDSLVNYTEAIVKRAKNSGVDQPSKDLTFVLGRFSTEERSRPRYLFRIYTNIRTVLDMKNGNHVDSWGIHEYKSESKLIKILKQN